MVCNGPIRGEKGSYVTLWDKRPPKMPLSLLCVGLLLLDMQPTLRLVSYPSETSLEKSKISFARSYQFELTSGLEMGVYFQFSQLQDPICCRFHRFCVHLTQWVHMSFDHTNLESLLSLVTSIHSVLQSFCLLHSRVPRALRGGAWGSYPIWMTFQGLTLSSLSGYGFLFLFLPAARRSLSDDGWVRQFWQYFFCLNENWLM